MRRTLVSTLVASVALLSALAPTVARADNSQGPVVRFATSLGNIDVQLLSQYAPNTVANFISYVNAGAYNTTFFHRSVTPSQTSPFGIIQGGSFDVVSGQRQQMSTNPPIALEYNLPNARGTLAMARTNDPNSATLGWFFNVTDNSSVFGPSNGGGYAVFGRILTQAGLSVMDTIAGQHVINDSVDNGSNGNYGQLPVINYSGPDQPTSTGTITPSNLIISSVTVLESPTVTIIEPTDGELFTQGQSATPRFSCNEDANGAGIASCTSSQLLLSTPGRYQFTVTGTDNVGNTTTKSVSYTVNPAPPGPTKTPPEPRAVAPTLSGSLTASKSGKLLLRLHCPTAARCTGSITLTMAAAHHRTARIASGRYAIAGRRSAKLTLRLDSATTKLLRAHKHLALTLTIAPAHGRKHIGRVTLRLSAH